MFAIQWLTDAAQEMRQYLPTVLAAVGLLVAGWLLALALRMVAGRIVTRVFERTRRHTPLQDAVSAAGARSMVPRLVSGFVFWLVFLLFAAAAIESLGFTVVTTVLSQVAYYLPNVFAAVVLIVGGVILGKVVGRAATAGAASAGIARAEGVGRTTQTAVVLVAIVIALEQIGIDAQLLVILVTVGIGATFASVALAFGIGARTTVSNIIAGYYVTQTYRVGQTVRIDGVEGEILQTTPTAVVLGTPEGQLLIPARKFSEDPSLLLMPGA